MRKRMLDPEFWLDEGLAKLSPHARLLYQGTWSICSDHFATFPNRPEWIKAQIFPYEEVKIKELLVELWDAGKLKLFIVEGNQYWYIKNFLKYQRVEKPSASQYPPCPDVNEYKLKESSLQAFEKYRKSQGGVGEWYERSRPEEKRSEVKGSEEKTIANASASAGKKSKAKQADEDTPRILSEERVQVLFELFKPVNPMWRDFFKNKTERKALEDMVKSLGFQAVEAEGHTKEEISEMAADYIITQGYESLKSSLEVLPKILSIPFVTKKATTPYNLKRNFGELMVAINQEKAKSNSKGKAVE